jgi:hypothetical protein
MDSREKHEQEGRVLVGKTSEPGLAIEWETKEWIDVQFFFLFERGRGWLKSFVVPEMK